MVRHHEGRGERAERGEGRGGERRGEEGRGGERRGEEGRGGERRERRGEEGGRGERGEGRRERGEGRGERGELGGYLYRDNLLTLCYLRYSFNCLLDYYERQRHDICRTELHFGTERSQIIVSGWPFNSARNRLALISKNTVWKEKKKKRGEREGSQGERGERGDREGRGERGRNETRGR